VKSVQSLIFDSDESLLTDINYDEMKQRANKAMREKPVGECRIPTDYWAGLGFSKSMPDSAIREKLALNNLSRYIGPSMPTTFENGDGELEGDVWKDPDDCAALDNKVIHQSALNNSLCELVAQMSSSQLDAGGRLGKDCVWPPRENALTTAQTSGGTSELADLFHRLGLSKYFDVFQQQEIDLATFLTLTDQDLKELGISTFGARRKMVLAIADYSERKRSIPPPPGLPNPFRCDSSTRRHDIVSQSGRW
jgi:protein bicaudal C